MRGARRLTYADSHMRDLLLALLHLAVLTAKLCGAGGVRAVMAENLLLKQQLIVLRRGSPAGAEPDARATGCCADSGRSSSVQDASERLPSPSSPRRSWRFIRPWSVANTAGCSHRRRARRSPDRRGRARHSSRPSSNSSRAILGSAVHGLRASSRRRSASTSTRTSCTACWRNTIAPPRAEPDPRGCRSSATPRDSLWSVDLFRCESIVLRSYWVLVVMDQFTRRLVGVGVHCGRRHGRRRLPHVQRRHSWSGRTATSQHRSRSAVRGAPVDGEPSDSGDRRNQDRAACAPVTPIRGAPDRDDAARISRPGAVLECP